MKSIVQPILLGFFATVCLHVVHSQDTISYGYDAAGNRISRTIIVDGLRSVPAPEPEEEPPVVYSERLSTVEVKIYPNPTEGLLKVELHNLPENQTADILLYDLSGGLISAHWRISNSADMNISKQPQGTYLMKIRVGDCQTEWKIIKR